MLTKDKRQRQNPPYRKTGVPQGEMNVKTPLEKTLSYSVQDLRNTCLACVEL